MDRTTPVAHSEDIELYIRTYYSLLRSSGPIRIRSLEDTHTAMNSNLHHLADSPALDVSALVYAAQRLPSCIPQTTLMVMGQMELVFGRAGYDVENWQTVKAKARRRKFYFEEKSGTLAAYIASVSDIDDLIPCLVAFQIEWNKLNQKLANSNLPSRLHQSSNSEASVPMDLLEEIRETLGLNSSDLARLCQIWQGEQLIVNLKLASQRRLDILVRVLGSGLSDYRRSIQTWWHTVEKGCKKQALLERPIYFVSSNTHSLVNLVTGYTDELREAILSFVQRENPEDLWSEYQYLSKNGDTGQLENFFYYTMRLYRQHLSCPDEIRARIVQYEQDAGIIRVNDPHCLDVEAQVIDLQKLNPDNVDPRLNKFSPKEWKRLKKSDALIFNIDYPLGMAAYQIFSQISTATGDTLGVYILGKAATLNGRVGDVMLPNVVYDEHSRNSYLFRNCFTAQDVAPYLRYGTVFDNQKAVTVRGTFLQNRQFMHVFYEEGYTDIEMEAGPYLSGVYEDIYPRRYPVNEIVNLFINAPYDIGLIHYASDTPISKRQTLLSKSMSYLGVDATYATSVAVLQRILAQEISRQSR